MTTATNAVFAVASVGAGAGQAALPVTERLPKPRHHNANAGRYRAKARSAQRIEDLFSCVAGLFRGVLDQVRPGAGAFRLRRSHPRSRLGHIRVDLAISREEPPSSCAVKVKSDADMGKTGAGLIQVVNDQGKDARAWTRTEAARPGSIGTLP
jgi:hypothetical protein